MKFIITKTGTAINVNHIISVTVTQFKEDFFVDIKSIDGEVYTTTPEFDTREKAQEELVKLIRVICR